jgi:DNA-binding Lrp family transcriptional regulator
MRSRAGLPGRRRGGRRDEQVSEVYSTSGQYDLLIKCYLPDSADIGHFVTERLQTLPGIKDTFTIIAFKAFSPDTSV